MPLITGPIVANSKRVIIKITVSNPHVGSHRVHILETIAALT